MEEIVFRKAVVFVMLCSISISVMGCDNATSVNHNSNNSEMTTPAEERDDDYTIFDNIIVGTAINDIESLYDVTDEFIKDGYEIVESCPYMENNILVVYSGETDSCVVSYNISDMKDKYYVEMKDVQLSSDTEISCITDEFAYVLDTRGKQLVYLNIKDESYEVIEMDDIPESIVVMDEGEQFFYTLENDCNIYQYTKATGNELSVYDATGMLEGIEVKYVIPGSNTLIVNVVSESYSGYAQLSLENQELIVMDGVEGELLYNGDNYMYKASGKDSTIIIFNPMTPRLTVEFQLDENAELDNLTLFDNGSHVISCIDSDKGTVVRFYEINAGIMENFIVIPTEYNILSLEYYAEKHNVLIHAQKEDNYKILIWNTKIIENIIK